MNEKKEAKREMMENKRNQSTGITLIALVVTIVVLLILAGVSINLVLGNNGIMKKAQESGEATLRESAKQEVAMMLQEYWMEKVGNEDFPMKNFFKKKLLNGEITAVIKNDGNIYVEKSGYVVTINSNGEITNVKRGKITVEDDEVPNIGDTVAYTPTAASNYMNLTSDTTGSSNNSDDGLAQEKLTWQVLTVNDDGSIDIIGSPTSTSVYFYGTLGYNNGVYLMNDACKALYSNTTLGVNARSVNLADMEKHLTTEGISIRNAHQYSSSTAKYGTTKTYTGSCSYYPVLYANQKGAGVGISNGATITQPDITSTNADGSLVNPDPYNAGAYTEEIKTDTYTRSVAGEKTEENTLTVTQTYYYIPINSTNYGDAASVISNNIYYWVASRYVDTYSDNAYFGLYGARGGLGGGNMFYSDNYTYGYNYCLRPVVSLPSDLIGSKNSSGVWTLIE